MTDLNHQQKAKWIKYDTKSSDQVQGLGQTESDAMKEELGGGENEMMC